MKKVFLLLVFALSIFISACGGGGSGSSPSGETDPPVVPSASTVAPSAPTGVTINAGNTRVSPSWTAVSGATSYNVYYSTTAGVTIANGTKIAGATSGSAVTGMVNGTPYYVVVTAVNDIGESAISSEVSATPVAPAAAPTGVTLASGNAKVTLNWPAVSGASSYNVYYNTTAGVTISNGTKITNTTSGTPITGLVNGTAYYFVVTAMKDGSESDVSSEAGTTPQAPSVGVPSGLTATTGENGQVRLSWAAVTGATSYNVYYGTAAGVTIATGIKVTGATSGGAITGLTNGIKYYFVVTAMSNSNTIENPASAWIAAIPQPIANLLGGAIQKEITLTGNVTTVNTVTANGTALLLGGWDDVAGGYVNAGNLTTDGTNLYYSRWTGYGWVKDDYYRVQIATGIQTSFPTGTNDATGTSSKRLQGITTDGNNLYGVSRNDGNIHKHVIATGAHTVLAAGCGGYNRCELTMDGTNLYLANSDNHTISRVVIASGAFSTIAGTSGLSGSANAWGGAARFNGPKGITTDGTYLYVADTGNNLIRKVVIATGEVTTLAGGYTGLTYDGTGVGAQFKAPMGITTDGKNLYVADSGAHIIRKVVIASGVVTTIAGSANATGNVNGSGSDARFNDPRSITTDGVSLFVSDYNNHVIRRIQ